MTMAFRDLDYQKRVLKRLDEYLDNLVEQKAKANKIERANAEETDPDLIHDSLDFPKATWEYLRENNLLPLSRNDIDYSPREDGAGRHVPNIVYKIPTGGGKTYLAVNSVSKIFNRYLNKHTGFVLWIAPNTAIYDQTKRQLLDRHHPCRQLLDNLSGNAVKFMEKTTTLNAADVDNNLCVMLLMLQSSNRKNKETLKIFKDRGDVYGFTPPEDDQFAHEQMFKKIPNLDKYDLTDSNYPWSPVRDSLGNALRSIQPIVVMDEGHKATSKLAFKTLYSFNPQFVLELTATPKDTNEHTQNILVEVTGKELDDEEMIKMPLNLDARQSDDWIVTLGAALDRLNGLQEKANRFRAETNCYIRPIMLVQVERTGKEQRDGIHIHAKDVKEWLTSVGNLDDNEVATKTAETDEIKNQDLLSPSNRVRVIITKNALQEGWDCPFAYVLCSLSASSSQSAMTQLVGRILRQPNAKKTKVDTLDQCYVVTHHIETNTVIEKVKEGLERDGLGDLAQCIRTDDAGDGTLRTIRRNPTFQNERILLPQVLSVKDGEKRELDYENDILYDLDWNSSLNDIDKFACTINKEYSAPERQLHRFEVTSGPLHNYAGDHLPEQHRFDPVYITHFIHDIIPNAWLGYDLVTGLIDCLTMRGFNMSDLERLSAHITEQFRKWLLEKRDELAEQLFRTKVGDGKIEFYLSSPKNIGWEMPDESFTSMPEDARILSNRHGQPVQQSLFQPIYHGELNTNERTVAVYMDEQQTLRWWHRNIARRHYNIQGWRKEKIYPDFICALKPNSDGLSKLLVLEMKGEHLSGNDDTKYKDAILKLMSEKVIIDDMPSVGEMDIQMDEKTTVHCELVLFREWENKLPSILSTEA